MTGLARRSDPIWSERSTLVSHRLPDDSLRIEDRSVDARSRVVHGAGIGAGSDHAAVATTETASHGLFERDVARAAVLGGQHGAGPHHRCRAAGEQLDRLAERARVEGPFERD